MTGGRMRTFIGCVPAFFAVQFIISTSTFAIKGSDLDINGYIGFEVGQMVKSQYQTNEVGHIWLGSSVGNINMKAIPSENLTVLLGMEGRLWFNTFPTEYLRNKQFTFTSTTDFCIHQAQGIYTLLKNEKLSLECAAGIMPYKYNPEARNLGEYHFRTGTYPAYIINDFDFPRARLSGGRVSVNYTGEAVSAGIDALILTERQMRPFHDLSLAAVANAGFLKAVTIGAGIELAHIWAVSDTVTSPHSDQTKYVNGTDTGYYTFSGTKLMARVTIDPLFSMRENLRGVIGNSGKIYGELAILGLKDYPADQGANNKYGYSGLKNKMPIMFGVNLPGWKILDICAIEFEHFSSPYADSYDQVLREGYPLPAA